MDKRAGQGQRRFRQIAVTALGFVLLLAGIAGLLLPFLPGVLLIAAGAVTLSRQSAKLRGVLERYARRFPALGRAMKRFSARDEAPGHRLTMTPNETLQTDTPRGWEENGVRRVLIFDQEVTSLVQHAEPFAARGFEVHKCTSVEAALRCIERDDFDFALIDQGSPAFEGRQVIGHLLRYNAHTPFLVLARCVDTDCYLQSLELGAVDYQEKPVSGEEINLIVDTHLVHKRHEEYRLSA